ncbi:MAG TPA: hypothetical protein VF762_02605, partial [Blastocatellia bacterium]
MNGSAFERRFIHRGLIPEPTHARTHKSGGRGLAATLYDRRYRWPGETEQIRQPGHLPVTVMQLCEPIL